MSSPSNYLRLCLLLAAVVAVSATTQAQNPIDAAAYQCQAVFTDRFSADAGGRQAEVALDSVNGYAASDYEQGVRGQLRYRIGDQGGWNSANYDCAVSLRDNRVIRADYDPRLNYNSTPSPLPGASSLQGPGWQVVTADYGSRNKRLDVTIRLRSLLNGTGKVRVNNANMGGDPAVGAEKVLRISARDSRGQTRQFSFEEGSELDAAIFYNYGAGAFTGPGWQVVWADYGTGNNRMDVTDHVRSLLSGSGMVKVNNANMGGDPAIGADKILRISARDSQGQTRQFDYKEGSNIDASQFFNYASANSYPGSGYRAREGYPDRDHYPGRDNDLQIIRAYYGLDNDTVDVTTLVRSMVRNGTLVVQVSNSNLGGDPARGRDKVLTVLYRYQGREDSSTVKEGNTIRIP